MTINSENINNYITGPLTEITVNRYIECLKDISEINKSNLLNNIIIFDLETTGFSPTKDKIIQIAAVKVKKGKVDKKFNKYIKQKNPINKEIIKLTGITNDILNNGEGIEIALEELKKFCDCDTIIAHNAKFDHSFLNVFENTSFFKEKLWLDSLELTKIAFPKLKNHKLEFLCNLFSINKSSHNAIDDVLALVDVYKATINSLYLQPYNLIRIISDLNNEDRWANNYVFKELLRIKKDKNESVSCETKYLKVVRDENVNPLFMELNNKNEEKESGDNNKLEVPENEEIKSFLSVDNMKRAYPNYRYREEQLDISYAILENFRRGGNLVAEAGTGVGKSLAYLICSILLAKKNNMPVGISTKTNTLLDQIVFSELPKIEQVLGKKINFQVVKGLNHYLCLRKIESLLKYSISKNDDKFDTKAGQIAYLLSFIEQSEYDDIDRLKINYKLLNKEEFACNRNNCYRNKCPYYGKRCFARGARLASEHADVVLTNHSLLFSDVATNGKLLPSIKHWILDESHDIEEEYRKALTLIITENNIKELAEKISNTRPKTCIFSKIEKGVSLKESKELFYILLNKCMNYSEKLFVSIIEFSVKLRELHAFDQNPKSRFEVEDVWISEKERERIEFKNLSTQGKIVQEDLIKLIQASQDIVSFLNNIEKYPNFQAEMSGLIYDMQEIRETIKVFLSDDKSYVHSVQISRGESAFPYAIKSELYNVGNSMTALFYSRIDSCAFISATLSIANSLFPFEESLGLEKGINIFEGQREQGREYKDNVERRLNKKTYEIIKQSPFNYDKNMHIFVAKDICAPNNGDEEKYKQYIEEISNLVENSIIAQDGSMLVLFTNKLDLKQVYQNCYGTCKKHNLQCISQDNNTSTYQLVSKFKEDERLSLFANKMFWEGFDAPGDTLRGIIIAKLPFSKPNNPLSREREKREKSSVFKKYTLPRTIIELKQALGRLIRNEVDRGIVVIADSRVSNKNYGQIILDSLPSNSIYIKNVDEIVEYIQRF